MNSKEALENVKKAPSFMGGNPKYWTCLESRIPFLEDIETIKQDLDRLEELVKVIRILKRRKYAEWIKNKFYDGVGYDDEEEKLFKKVFGSSWRKY